MTALVVNKMSTENRLPRISNGTLKFFKDLSQFRQTYKSLPSLPTYTVQGVAGTRWGEDEGIDRKGFSSNSEFTKDRNNFDCCHPASEDPDHLKYEGYIIVESFNNSIYMYQNERIVAMNGSAYTMRTSLAIIHWNENIANKKFPKSMHRDLTVMRCPVSNTCRRVPRDPKCEIFPRHDTQRISLHDGKHVLDEATRKAIEDNMTSLYRNTHYNKQFKDTIRFMVDKAQRDAQYRLETAHHNQTPTCCRVHTHPDPCPFCWYGGYNKDFEEKLANFQSRLHSSTKFPSNGYYGNCRRQCIIEQSEHEHDCDCMKQSCSICFQKAVNVDVEKNSGNNRSYDGKVNENSEAKAETGQIETCKNESDVFGPWQEYKKKGEGVEEQLVFNDIYQSKLPSTIHCQSSQNEYTTDWENRHLKHNNLSTNQRKSLCRAEVDVTNKNTLKRPQTIQAHTLDAVIAGLTPKTSHTSRNIWTFRDNNNLRIPCIAAVLGTSDRSDAHKRYHIQHPEPIPDLRDNMKNPRRVEFYGFNSAVRR